MSSSVTLSTPLNQGYLGREDPANPGAGNNFTWTNNKIRRVQLRSLTFIFTASAVVGNRLINLNIGFTGLEYSNWKAENAIVASEAHLFYFCMEYPFYEKQIGNVHWAPLFPGFLVHQEMSLSTSITGILAGDRITAIRMSYSAWPEYRGL